ncbi:cytidine deaminase [soil metagenome]
MDKKALLEAAIAARLNAYAPYSRFAVGAALLGKSGRVYLGCNVENISYGLTQCAERNALATAVAAGELAFESVTIVADTELPISPCGACRQVMAEFEADLEIVCATLSGQSETFRLSQLFPRAKTGILDTK